MKFKSFLACATLFVFQVSAVRGQDNSVAKEEIEKINGLFVFQVGIPGNEMQEAIQNKMGNAGFGGAIIVLTNPATWGKNKRNSPLRIGGEVGYTYYGRFITDVEYNGYHGDFKTSYGIIQLNGVLQVRPRVRQKVTPFFELLAGGNFYMSTIKENFDVLRSVTGIENLSLETHSSSSFNKGIAVGCTIGKPEKIDAAKFAIRFSYNRGGSFSYIVRNSVSLDLPSNRLLYETGEAEANYFMVQIGVGF